MDQRHQPLLAQRFVEGVLVAHREDAAAAAILDDREDDVGHGRPGLVQDAQLEELDAAFGLTDSSNSEIAHSWLLIAIRQDNHRLATHLVNRGADVNVATGEIVSEMPTEGDVSHMLAIPGSGDLIYTSDIRDGTVTEIEVARGASVRKFKVPVTPEAVGVTPNGSAVCVGSKDLGMVTVIVQVPVSSEAKTSTTCVLMRASLSAVDVLVVGVVQGAQ